MTQHPTDEAKKRADELIELWRVVEHGDAKPEIIIPWVINALTDAVVIDAPIVEGLDEALKIYDRQVHPGLRNDAVWLHPIVKAAKLYVQGRTQSAVPDVWGYLRFPTMLRKMWSGQEVQKWIDDRLRQHLSVAPPVTGGAWLPVSQWEEDDADCPFIFIDEDGDLYCTRFTSPISSDWPEKGGLYPYFQRIEKNSAWDVHRAMTRQPQPESGE